MVAGMRPTWTAILAAVATAGSSCSPMMKAASSGIGSRAIPAHSFARMGAPLRKASGANESAKRDEAIRQAQEEQARRQSEAAVMALALWRAATPARGDHPYLMRKQVAPVPTLREIDADEAKAILGYAPKSDGELLTGRLLVAPVKVGEKLSTAELIDSDGRKTAIFGGAKRGGYWAAQSLPDDDDGLAHRRGRSYGVIREGGNRASRRGGIVVQQSGDSREGDARAVSEGANRHPRRPWQWTG